MKLSITLFTAWCFLHVVSGFHLDRAAKEVHKGPTGPACVEGASWKQDCNDCFCSNGRAACTFKICPTEPRINLAQALEKNFADLFEVDPDLALSTSVKILQNIREDIPDPVRRHWYYPGDIPGIWV